MLILVVGGALMQPHGNPLTLEVCQRLPKLLEHHGLLLQLLHWDEAVVVRQILLDLLHRLLQVTVSTKQGGLAPGPHGGWENESRIGDHDDTRDGDGTGGGSEPGRGVWAAGSPPRAHFSCWVMSSSSFRYRSLSSSTRLRWRCSGSSCLRMVSVTRTLISVSVRLSIVFTVSWFCSWGGFGGGQSKAGWADLHEVTGKGAFPAPRGWVG